MNSATRACALFVRVANASSAPGGGEESKVPAHGTQPPSGTQHVGCSAPVCSFRSAGLASCSASLVTLPAAPSQRTACARALALKRAAARRAFSSSAASAMAPEQAGESSERCRCACCNARFAAACARLLGAPPPFDRCPPARPAGPGPMATDFTNMGVQDMMKLYYCELQRVGSSAGQRRAAAGAHPPACRPCGPPCCFALLPRNPPPPALPCRLGSILRIHMPLPCCLALPRLQPGCSPTRKCTSGWRMATVSRGDGGDRQAGQGCLN